MYDLKNCPLCNRQHIEDTTVFEYTQWLINTMPVYLPDRKHIKLIAT